ncbi:hypothetical protein LXL04_021509 [Taraxacum kok-saghyz]
MASSSSSSTPSAPMFTSQSWSYDVFLSFRGEDTRKTFVDHLYSALVQQGIDTYKDDETIPRGESIGPSLMKAIEESQIAVIVFSVNYADSSWCLDELAHIMKCKDTTGQIVMPIFYDVDPSTVRKQNEKYGKAFVKHKLLNKNKVEAWKKALVDASNISGWEPKKIANGHESKAIKEIVEYISSRLQVSASANEKLIGMSDRVQRLQSELQIGSGGVRMIGIWGVGGGGKTTLASCTYDEIYRKFDGCCFIANIREKSRKHGLEKLQKKILKKIEGKSGGKGRCLIDKKLRNRRVLIVLDDVDQLDQLEALAGSPDWFGDGSRILITTRDEHILKAHKVVVHDISLLQGDEAIKLFRKHAFRGCLPMKDYEQLSEEVVYYAGGLPLALTVLGSSLCDKNIDQWRSALARLQEIPDDKILEKLKISFDGLTKVQKDLFLDIACFFRWEKKDEAMGVLNACGFHPVIGVEELRQKGLITISHGCLDMHDLVQDMGHHIIRGEHPKNPKKYTRVWMKEDVLRLCAMDATMDLDKIEGLRASFLSYTEFTEYFEGSLPPKLDEYFRIPANREPIPPILANMRNLRYIDWKGDHANPLLNTFPPRELCCLILRGSMQDQLWNGYKQLRNLKIMELYNLDNLIMTPNFDGIPYLEKFKLYRCQKLEEIHSSFGDLERLVSLTIEGCLSIKTCPSITRLKKLETLSFKASPILFELSEIRQKMEKLEVEENMRSDVLLLAYLTNIRLCLFHRDLRKLNLSFCNLEDKDMSSAIWELPNLQELNLSGNNFSQLDFSLIRLPQLKFLDVSNCMELPVDVGFTPNPNHSLVSEVEGGRILYYALWLRLSLICHIRNKVDRFVYDRIIYKLGVYIYGRFCLGKTWYLSGPSDPPLFPGNPLSDISHNKLGIPLSLAVLKALFCYSLKTFGDTLYRKWLWKVSVYGSNEIDPLDGWMLLNSMFQGNAFEDHFISATVQYQIPKGVFGRLFWGNKFTLHLPPNWYDNFSGFVLHAVNAVSINDRNPEFDIIIKKEVDEDSRFRVYNEELEPEDHPGSMITYVGYVSFNSLRNTMCLNSTYKMISFSGMACSILDRVGVELVRKDDSVQTKEAVEDRSEFWDEELFHRSTFTIEHGSKSSIKIKWLPNYF